MKQIYFTILFALISIISFSQTNIDVSSAITINSFPHTESNIDSSSAGSATGMNGACASIPCCNVLYYRVEIPSNGDLEVVSDVFTNLATSILAYTPDVPSPTTNSQLTFVSQPGNFCGFRDTLTLTGLNANSVYYILLFNQNQQSSIFGPSSNFTFSFTPDGTLGIENVDKGINKISLYPNPSSNSIQISGLTGVENYTIYNVVGKEISKGVISLDEKIDVKNYSNGLYFLKFENGNTIKFIKE